MKQGLENVKLENVKLVNKLIEESLNEFLQTDYYARCLSLNSNFNLEIEITKEENEKLYNSGLYCMIVEFIYNSIGYKPYSVQFKCSNLWFYRYDFNNKSITYSQYEICLKTLNSSIILENKLNKYFSPNVSFDIENNSQTTLMSVSLTIENLFSAFYKPYIQKKFENIKHNNIQMKSQNVYFNFNNISNNLYWDNFIYLYDNIDSLVFSKNIVFRLSVLDCNDDGINYNRIIFVLRNLLEILYKAKNRFIANKKLELLDIFDLEKFPNSVILDKIMELDKTLIDELKNYFSEIFVSSFF